MYVSRILPGSDESLARAAAYRELQPAKWQQRFAGLLQAGLVRLCAWPGREMSLRISRFPCGESTPLLVSFCAERFREAQATGCLLSIDLSHARPDARSDTAGSWVRLFERQLAAELQSDRSNAPAVPVCFSVTEQHPDLEAIISLRHSSLLATVAIAVRYGDCLMGSGTASARGQLLVRHSHADFRLKLVPHMSLRPLTGLHAHEQGDSVMPSGMFEAAKDTAWLMLEVNAVQLAAAVRPREQLSLSLRFADNLIDVIEWPRPVLQLDALLNRRVGLHITGIGDLLCDRGMSPHKPETFAWLNRWLGFVRRCLLRESRLLAAQRGPFPQLDADELIAELAPRYGADNARQLLKNSILRHRHVLALSPFALFPDKPATCPDSSWLNLIPALKYADALTMYGPDPRERLSASDWSRLLQLTGALAGANTVVTETTAVSKFA
jgi:hypothetical protein